MGCREQDLAVCEARERPVDHWSLSLFCFMEAFTGGTSQCIADKGPVLSTSAAIKLHLKFMFVSVTLLDRTESRKRLLLLHSHNTLVTLL